MLTKPKKGAEIIINDNSDYMEKLNGVLSSESKLAKTPTEKEWEKLNRKLNFYKITGLKAERKNWFHNCWVNATHRHNYSQIVQPTDGA